MTFLPGQSGNSGGKPTAFVILERLIRSRTKNGEWCVGKLLEFIEHARDQNVKLAALKLLMEYGFGKPRQAVELNAGDGNGIQIIVTTGVLQPERQLPLIEAQGTKVIEHKPGMPANYVTDVLLAKEKRVS